MSFVFLNNLIFGLNQNSSYKYYSKINNHKNLTGKNDGDSSTLEGRKYFLNCNGVVGDMLYITDKKTGNKGHCLAEVYIYELGKFIFLSFMKIGRLGFA